MTLTTRMASVASKLRGRVGAIAVGSALFTVVFASVALAHDTWLLPSSLRVPVGRAIMLDLTSGEAFPVDDFAIAPSRVVRADVRVGGATRPLATSRRAPLALRYTWRPERAGVAAFAVELAPRKLTLTPDKVAEYLDEIDATPALRAAWNSTPAPKRWREQYTKHAVTFVRVGEVCGDSSSGSASNTSWSAPLGLGLELVPERDPTALRVADTLPVRVLCHGDPLPGFAVGARPAGAATATFVTTDAAGRARVVLPKAGRWLIAGTDLRRSTRPGLDWESDFTTLTLAVRARTGNENRREGSVHGRHATAAEPSCVPASDAATTAAPVAATEERAFRRVLAAEWRRHPRSQLADLYTFVYHAAMGPAHAGLDSAMAAAWLAREVAALGPVSPAWLSELPTEPLSPSGDLVRVNLRPYVARGGNVSALARAFTMSARRIVPSIARLERYSRYAEDAAVARELPIDASALRAFFAAQRSRGYPTVEHSAAYVASYRPAYRVVIRNLVPPVLRGTVRQRTPPTH